MGRRARPVELLRASGRKHLTKAEIRTRTEKEAALRPDADKVAPPDWLSAEARELFDAIVREDAAREQPIITNLDVEALAHYCDAVVRYRAISRDLDEGGYVAESPQGVKKNPLLDALKLYKSVIERGESKFGFDPSSRASLAIPRGDGGADPFEEKFGAGARAGSA